MVAVVAKRPVRTELTQALCDRRQAAIRTTDCDSSSIKFKDDGNDNVQYGYMVKSIEEDHDLFRPSLCSGHISHLSAFVHALDLTTQFPIAACWTWGSGGLAASARYQRSEVGGKEIRFRLCAVWYGVCWTEYVLIECYDS